MYQLLRALLFKFDAESVHRVVTSLLDGAVYLKPIRSLTRSYFHVPAKELEVHAFGLVFPSPVGLAAGFDKNAEHINALGALGFGHVEIGTVTGEAQEGNPRPRLFRLPADEAILNRMGFNNHGSAAVARRLATLQPETVLGINIGKTKVVPLENAADDYEMTFRRLFKYGRYFVVNVSSPNTPGLRELQDRGPLTEILERLQVANAELAKEHHVPEKPILVKIAPDLTDSQIVDAVEVAEACNLAGIVAANTTISREKLKTTDVDSFGAGGVSGRPVAERRNEIIRLIRQHTDLPIIGVGGIFDGNDAWSALEAGATLVQVWTAFVYEGPTIVRSINQEILKRCRENQFASVSEVGTAKAS